MSDDLAGRFAKLQAARAADVIDEAAYQASLARLRQQYGEAEVNKLLYGGNSGGPRSVQNIGGKAKVGTAIAGDHHGNITIGSMDFSDNKRVISAGTQAQSTKPPMAVATRLPLPTTLSADGVHFTNGHALLIGIGSYKQSYFNAPKTAADAEQLAALLTDQTIAAYPAAQVRVLSGNAATRQSILDALDRFAQQLVAAPQATAVLFFAGHGVKREEDFYLLPYDYEYPYAKETAISAALFGEKVAAIRQHAQKLIVLLNCCHSGGVGDSVLDAGDPGEQTDTPPVSFVEQLVGGSGHVVISAAKAAEKAGAVSTVEPTLTVFGAQLLAALGGKAPGDSAAIGVFDLFAFLSAQVPQDARGISHGGKPLAQHPLFYAHQVDQNFALALRPGWQGGTLGDDISAQVQELAQLEIQLAHYASEDEAPVVLVQRRDALVASFELL